jgi:hypothetical protein
MKTGDFKVIAIIAAFNEEDIIGQVVADLVAQGVLVYLLDNDSTDRTREIVSGFLGAGVLGIEAFQSKVEAGLPFYDWHGILRRKEALAGDLNADWFIHHDADEFRESPWSHLTLAESIREADAFGYNAIDFELLNFQPTRDEFCQSDDVREAFQFYEPGKPWDKIQIRCWKKQSMPVDLASSGGHQAIFPGRRVFPLRWILRHYPLRGQAHAERKIFSERRSRLLSSERERGWHVQYDQVHPGQRFIVDAETLRRYDAREVRLQLLLNNRRVEELEARPDTRGSFLDEARRVEARLSQDLDVQNREVQRLGIALDERNRETDRLARDLDLQNREVERLSHELDKQNRQVETLHTALDQRHHEVQRLEAELDSSNLQTNHLIQANEILQRTAATREGEISRLAGDISAARAHIDALLASRSWRWTRALRAVHRSFFDRERG